jgi:hypothetical protein
MHDFVWILLDYMYIEQKTIYASRQLFQHRIWELIVILNREELN